jgi:hypothetical protein
MPTSLYYEFDVDLIPPFDSLCLFLLIVARAVPAASRLDLHLRFFDDDTRLLALATLVFIVHFDWPACILLWPSLVLSLGSCSDTKFYSYSFSCIV